MSAEVPCVLMIANEFIFCFLYRKPEFAKLLEKIDQMQNGTLLHKEKRMKSQTEQKDNYISLHVSHIITHKSGTSRLFPRLSLPEVVVIAPTTGTRKRQRRLLFLCRIFRFLLAGRRYRRSYDNSKIPWHVFGHNGTTNTNVQRRSTLENGRTWFFPLHKLAVRHCEYRTVRVLILKNSSNM